MDFASYKDYCTKKFRLLAHKFLREEEPLTTTKRCCISLRQNECSLIGMNYHSDIQEVAFFEKLKYEDIGTLKLVLSGIVEKYQLANVPVSWLLNPNSYDLNIVDAMPVQRSEMQTALSWRIRSLVKYPIEEAILEYFELPPKKNTPNSPLIAAVTTQKSMIVDYVDMIKSTGLRLNQINIIELALLNLAALFENDEKSTAFLYFYDSAMILNISCQKVLYFSRRIAVTRTGEAESQLDLEKLCLEILRYFDFFRSQWRLSTPTRIFAISEIGDSVQLAKTLTERLLITVEPYNLTGTFLSNEQRDVINSQYLLEYGCLLMKDHVNVAARN